ncbi:MAG: GNAT family N-acetyltransferase [Acidobacteriaceae bacterium]|nr:GNAT family N-acetyltransferase [Acidobacteriaceae bacterium]
MSGDPLVVRPAALDDVPQIAAMCHDLWPDSGVDEHAEQVLRAVTGEGPGTLPTVYLVAQQPGGEVIGFVEVGLRSHADGCDPSHPAGFVEGWYVLPAFRRKRVGARLIAAAEGWARGHGCIEMASDTWLDNAESQIAHQALGFEVVDRCVHYRKRL